MDPAIFLEKLQTQFRVLITSIIHKSIRLSQKIRLVKLKYIIFQRFFKIHVVTKNSHFFIFFLFFFKNSPLCAPRKLKIYFLSFFSYDIGLYHSENHASPYNRELLAYFFCNFIQPHRAIFKVKPAKKNFVKIIQRPHKSP